MEQETFDLVHDRFPVRYEPSFELFGTYPDTHFATVRDPEGRPAALIREILQDDRFDLPARLSALSELEAHGIRIPPYFAFRLQQQDFLLAGYVAGEVAGEGRAAAGKLSPHQQEMMLQNAMNLGRYYLDCFTAGREHLVDVVHPFQYLITEDRLVMVDLDLFACAVPDDRPAQIRGLGSHLYSIGIEWIPLLDESAGYSLRFQLDELFREYEPYDTLLEELPSGHIVFDERWDGSGEFT